MMYAYNILQEMKSLGLNKDNSIVHFGFCDNGLNFLDEIKKNDLEIFYLGVDTSDKVEESIIEHEESQNYAFQKRTLQDFLDTENHIFNYVLITGIFDKPVYEEKQYIFISSVIERCFSLAHNIVFTMDVEKYRKDYNFSILYVINNIINIYDKVNIKKINNTKYIFSISH